MAESPALVSSAVHFPRAKRAGLKRETVQIGSTLTTIGRWHLTRLVGQGRFTHVYRACPLDTHEALDGDFAVKVVHPQWAADTLARTLLEREARVSREVRHPRLVTVLADHSDADPPYLVAPYLEGASLRQVIACGPRSLAQSLSITRQLAEALAALHDAGWLHGDVKPENVRLAPSGHATLIDLGLARVLGSTECLTEHAIAGSLRYAAPETFSPADRLTAASDIYSLGITLLDLFTGGLASNLSAAEISHMHRREAPPDLREFVPSATDELAALVRRMLAKDPLRRPDAAQLVRELATAEIEAFAAWQVSD
ncbi:MAG: serine/threonine protein kinase [Pirellulaceae bacterium]|jgi:serine/threonine-protein kinase|nr:serine/threonine protein kinase [Pirellulaceae bacterium]